MKSNPVLPGFLSDWYAKVKCTNVHEMENVLSWARENGAKCPKNFNGDDVYPFYLTINGDGVSWTDHADPVSDVLFTYEEFALASKSVTMVENISIDVLQKRLKDASDSGHEYFMLPLLTAARQETAAWIEQSGMQFAATKNFVVYDKRVYMAIYFN